MGISTSNLWWLWVSLTLPLTLAVFVARWVYRRKSERIEKNPSQDHTKRKILAFWSREAASEKIVA